jgi:hypothetical protein
VILRFFQTSLLAAALLLGTAQVAPVFGGGQ